MKYRPFLFTALVAAFSAGLFPACQKTSVPSPGDAMQETDISLPEVARLLSSLPLEEEHLKEVHDAALSSAENGYDEEYRMQDLFNTPGSGVGALPAKAGTPYAHPLRDLLREAMGGAATKAGGDTHPWLDALALSDVQIYWPYSESWDGHSLPIITYDPGEGATTGEGFALQSDGTVKKVLVSEESCFQGRPVWVVNRNSDALYKSLELLRREDPSWGQGGGDILVKGGAKEEDFKTLILRSFHAHRQYDSWFAGASEYFVKLGSVPDFRASTEAEMRLYDPAITDFMVVVRRSQVGKDVPFNAILASEWTPQLSSCALCLVEDDGGTRTNWKCSALVKVNSKSYGIELDIPIHTRDDIVWRGALTRSFIERNSGSPVRLGDVDLVLELI